MFVACKDSRSMFIQNMYWKLFQIMSFNVFRLLFVLVAIQVFIKVCSVFGINSNALQGFPLRGGACFLDAVYCFVDLRLRHFLLLNKKAFTHFVIC